MLRRKLIFPLVALATMALMLSATGASAKPHETVGDPTTTCNVSGSVSLTPGLDNNPSNNHYTVLAGWACEGKKSGIYGVTAESDTTDYWHQGLGEDCAQGGSITELQTDGSLDVHSGVLSATGPKDMIGEVHFVRLAQVFLADGPLWEGFNDVNDLPTAKQTPPDQWFQAELVFIPTSGDCTKQNPVTVANLLGTAQIFNAVDVVAHHCGGDEPKDTKNNHCF